MSNFVINPYRFAVDSCTYTVTGSNQQTDFEADQKRIMGTQLTSGNALIGESFCGVKVWLQVPEGFSPDGVVISGGVVNISNDTGNLDITCAETFNADAIGTSYVEKTFTYSGSYTLAEDDVIGVRSSTDQGGGVSTFNVSGSNADVMNNARFAWLQSGSWANNTTYRPQGAIGTS